MSFLAHADDSSDDADVLEAAFAFLDDWESSSSSSSRSFTGSSSEDSSALSPSPLPTWSVDSSPPTSHGTLEIAMSAHTQRAFTRPRRAKQRAPPRNKKAEILELREQVVRLKARLAQLQGGDEATSPSSPSSPPRRPLLLQLYASGSRDSEEQKLRQAEALNRTLRAALEKQMSMGRRLTAVFSKQSATIVRAAIPTAAAHASSANSSVMSYAPQPELNVLVDTSTAFAPSSVSSYFLDPFTTTDDSFVFAELFGYLERSREHITAVAVGLHRYDASRVASSSHVHADPLVGQVFEFSMSAPLSCSLRALDKFAWGHLSSKFTDKDGKVAFTKKLLPQSGRIEMRFTMTFDCALGKLAVEGRTAMRRVEEADRVLIVFTSLLIPSGMSGLLFRQSGCLVLSKTATAEDASGAHAREASLVQSYYRIHAEMTRDALSQDREHAAYVRDFVLAAQSEQMRVYQLTVQQSMLQALAPTSPLSWSAHGSVSPVDCR